MKLAVARGDVALLRFTARTTPGGKATVSGGETPLQTYVMPVFEDDSMASGYKKSLLGAQTTNATALNYSIPFTIEAEDGSGNATLQFELGFRQVQSVDITGFSLLLWRKASGVNASQLPRCCNSGQYPGRAAGSAWRTEALARINTLRRGNLTVVISGASLRDMPDTGCSNARCISPSSSATATTCAVNATMERSNFHFGSAVNLQVWNGYGNSSSTDATTYRGWFLRLFDTAVFESAMKWPSWAGSDAQVRNETFSLIGVLLEAGIRIRGHNLVWPSCGGPGKVPSSVCAADVAHANQSSARKHLEEAIEAHIADEVGTLRAVGCCEEFDVVNEPYGNVAISDALREGNEPVLWWLNATRRANPTAGRRINDDKICTGIPAFEGAELDFYDSYLGWLLRNGPGLLTGVGCESHLQGTMLPGPEAVMARYRALAALMPAAAADKSGASVGAAPWSVRVTEFDVVTDDLQLYADYLRDALIAAYSTEVVDGFLMWGFMDAHHWLHSAPLFHADWSPKPGLAVWQRYVLGEWRSTQEGQASPAAATQEGTGSATLLYWTSPPMHHGTYRVAVTCSDGRGNTITGVALDGPNATITVSVQ